jgi:hypothetical protein
MIVSISIVVIVGEPDKSLAALVIFGILILIYFVLWLVDIIWIALNKMKDANGNPLK